MLIYNEADEVKQVMSQTFPTFSEIMLVPYLYQYNRAVLQLAFGQEPLFSIHRRLVVLFHSELLGNY